MYIGLVELIVCISPCSVIVLFLCFVHSMIVCGCLLCGLVASWWSLIWLHIILNSRYCYRQIGCSSFSRLHSPLLFNSAVFPCSLPSQVLCLYTSLATKVGHIGRAYCLLCLKGYSGRAICSVRKWL